MIITRNLKKSLQNWYLLLGHNQRSAIKISKSFSEKTLKNMCWYITLLSKENFWRNGEMKKFCTHFLNVNKNWHQVLEKYLQSHLNVIEIMKLWKEMYHILQINEIY